MPNKTRRILRRPAAVKSPACVKIERPRDADHERTGLRILRRPHVEQRTGLRRSAIYQAIAEGRFPRPVSLGPKAVGWLEHEVDGWVAERIAARDARR
jgi:prophage regulatory protein